MVDKEVPGMTPRPLYCYGSGEPGGDDWPSPCSERPIGQTTVTTATWNYFQTRLLNQFEAFICQRWAGDRGRLTPLEG